MIDRLVCPIGLPGLGGKEPAVIAASVAAQLLIVRQDSGLGLGQLSRGQELSGTRSG
jgi:xanthine/CO dehydrogenase XdhC/CoxF family maturation factor